MAGPNNEKIQEFRADALNVGAQAAMVEPNGVSSQRLGDLFNVSGSNALQNERELGLKSGSLDGAGGSGALAAARILEQHDKEAAQRKAANDTALFLEMLQSLSDQIRNLEEQIARYDEQIDATDSLIDILASGGEIDPTDPEHQRLLRLAGIPEDEWGTVTLDDLHTHRADVQRDRDIAKADRDDKARALNNMEATEESLVRNGSIDTSTLDMGEAVEEYSNINPEFDTSAATAEDVVQIGAIQNADLAASDSTLQDMDLKWFKAEYANATFEGLTSQEVTRYISENLIDKLNTRAKEELMLDSEIGYAAREVVALDRLNDILDGSALDEIDELVIMDLELLPNSVKSILARSDQVDSSIKEYLGMDEGVISSNPEHNAQ